MGKIKDSSSDGEMSIENEPKPIVRKKKKIVKEMSRNMKTHKQQSKMVEKRNIMSEVAKKVNMKPINKSLEDKQQVFHRIVERLKDQPSRVKKNQKKNRIILKKELRKALELEKVYRKKSQELKNDAIQQEIPKTKDQKKGKFNTDQRKSIAEFHHLMGAGIQNIRNMVAKNISMK